MYHSQVLGACIALWVGLLVALPPRPSPWLVFASGLPLLAVVSRRLAARRRSAWGAYVRDTADLHGLAIVLLYALAIQMVDAHGITTDGVTYFAQLRSVVVDRDLDVTREFEILGQPTRPTHVVPIGPTIVWTPLYLVVTIADALGRAAGAWKGPADPALQGLGLPYVRAVLLSSFAIAAAGLFALAWFLRERFSRTITWLTVVLVLGATPLFWYMVYEPSMTHAASFGFAALFAVACSRWIPGRGATTRQALILGALLGLAFDARSQEVVFAVLPAFLVFGADRPWPQRLRAARHLAGWAFLGALPWLLLQALHSYVLFSRYEYSLVGQGGYFQPWSSRWMDTLFSSWHGFFSWTPIAYVAALGTVAYLRRDWRWAASGLVVLWLTAWINGATQDWAAGWSFGGRRFISTLVLLAPGLALVLQGIRARPLWALATLVAAALWWNHLLMVQYTTGLLPKDEPVSFARLVRQQGDLQTRSPFWYPFAFPANAWFAWRQGLPVEKYDELAPAPIRETFEVRFDRHVEKFQLDGWGGPGGDDWGPLWWVGGRDAVMAVPIALPPGPATLTVRARTRLDEPMVRAELAVLVADTEVGRFGAGVPDAATATIAVDAATAARLFRRGFNRVTFRSLGTARVDPADTRPAGPLASRNDPAFPVAIYEVRIAPAR